MVSLRSETCDDKHNLTDSAETYGTSLRTQRSYVYNTLIIIINIQYIYLHVR